VANTPILFYGIRSMVAAGITDIGVIVGDTRDEVMAALGDGAQFDASITYIPQDEPLGLAHCLLIARDFLGDDDFVMYLGDNLLEQDLRAFVDAFISARRGDAPPSAQILLKRVPDPHRFGIATLDPDGHVVELVEKPEHPPSDLALVGVYLFDPLIHDAVAAIKPSDRGELEITDAIQWLVDNGHRVRQEILTGWWIDTGKLTPLLEANRLILETIEARIDGDVDIESTIDGRVVIEAGARVVNSTVRGPVAIGPGTEIVDSFIGPFSAIGADCVVRHSEIEHSVVMDGSQVLDIPRLEDSLIGSDAVVTRSRRKPRAVRLMVGDHCQIDVE
jgi:glucose-1-phosphate thymidylyltransferase